jgi:hypothetical protein
MQHGIAGVVRHMQVVLAADLLYDDVQTDALCSFLHEFLAAAAARRSRLALQHACAAGAGGGQEGVLSGAWALAGDWRGPQACAFAAARPQVLLAAEKRFVFTLDDRDVRAPAFDHFLSRVRMDVDSLSSTAGHAARASLAYMCSNLPRNDSEAVSSGRGHLVASFLDVASIPQAVGGERSSHLELLQVRLQH